jgi:hypothetical protein
VGLGEVVQLGGHLRQGPGQLGQLGEPAPAGGDPELGEGAGGLGEQVVQAGPARSSGGWMLSKVPWADPASSSASTSTWVR